MPFLVIVEAFNISFLLWFTSRSVISFMWTSGLAPPSQFRFSNKCLRFWMETLIIPRGFFIVQSFFHHLQSDNITWAKSSNKCCPPGIPTCLKGSTTAPVEREEVRKSWPLAGLVQVSMDRAFKQGSERVGVVIWDEVSGVLADIECRLRGIVDASHAKIMPKIWKWITLAQEMYFCTL